MDNPTTVLLAFWYTGLPTSLSPFLKKKTVHSSGYGSWPMLIAEYQGLGQIWRSITKSSL